MVQICGWLSLKNTVIENLLFVMFPPTNKVTKFTSVKRKVVKIQQFKNEQGGYDADTFLVDENVSPNVLKFLPDSVHDVRPTAK